MRILLSFKESEKELINFLDKKSKYISKSGYIKLLLSEKLEEEEAKRKNNE